MSNEEKSPVSFLRDVNDIVKLITGKSIPDLAKRSAELFGKETAKKLSLSSPKLPPDSPYAILGVRPDASTLVIRLTFRALVKDMHQISDEYKRLNDAYMKILSDRGEG